MTHNNDAGRSILSSFVCSSIILLFLLDNDYTSWLIVGSLAVSTAIEGWKVNRVLKPKLVWYATHASRALSFACLLLFRFVSFRFVSFRFWFWFCFLSVSLSLYPPLPSNRTSLVRRWRDCPNARDTFSFEPQPSLFIDFWLRIVLPRRGETDVCNFNVRTY